ncbi:dehydrogenase/reductase SDR family member 9-like [Protopterus annectens]|uniref:dehydrogenase/reductase SDR family member 9-like n=1 Tax=Protopterus annectens TaxID=7888 RepID=UPI001CFB2FC1|nr:dehydrogenase/reductase SDR family member 9-like [Protopterus annectens]XP_043931512.1 dehydrogenase/reductase SDR family member 9-like [Protopterus annectens]XP_043931513.1 dehydrogenase/reductase SDR family member 9-like [Protopterus annectens]XP_043931514.1 dehydrogenase/reductase SDR family member 9-like [Protopterus annectens]XP_043931515.1 dehydrogenase/reductase SDR family member 9-like [Protopterus annectens]XP_043931516.1 dehydrogenase/reductase SDR family member 9-like [Protopteru
MLLFFIPVLLIVYLYWWRRDKQKIENVIGNYIFITGCDTGFGNAAAKRFDKLGFHVLAGCFTEKGALQLQAVTSERLKTVQMDISKPDSVKKAAEWVKSQVGEQGLWGLINNAGISGIIAPTDWLKIDHFRKPIEVNLLGTIDVTLNVLPLLKKRKGRIVIVASVLGRVAPHGGGYSPSKFGLEGFNDSLRRDMQPFEIKVSCIEPGLFKTGMNNDNKQYEAKLALWNEVPTVVRKQYGDNYFHKSEEQMLKHRESLFKDDLSPVVKCMEHAMIAKYPRTRYSVGSDAAFLWLPLSYMPSVLQDIAVCRTKIKLANPNFV